MSKLSRNKVLLRKRRTRARHRAEREVSIVKMMRYANRLDLTVDGQPLILRRDGAHVFGEVEI